MLGTGKLAVRAGAGIFHGVTGIAYSGWYLGARAPLVQSTTITNGNADSPGGGSLNTVRTPIDAGSGNCPVPPNGPEPAEAATGIEDEEFADWTGTPLDSFVDDVRLVSFMGLAVRGGPSSPSQRSVAEEILDAGSPPIPFVVNPRAVEDGPSPEEFFVASASPSSPAPEVSQAVAPAVEPTVAPDIAPAVLPAVIPAVKRFSRPLTSASAVPGRPRRGAPVVAESFWGFGASAEGVRTLPSPEEDPHVAGLLTRRREARTPSGFENLPRRRSSDGH